jgi:hypothetical protein
VLWLLLGFSLTTLLTVGVVWLLDPRYRFNDDMIIASILSGDYTGEPTLQTLNLGEVLSYFLVLLYSLWPDFSWLLWIQEFTLVVSFVFSAGIILWLFFKSNGRRLPGSSFVILLGCQLLIFFCLISLPTPTFTISAFIPGMMAIVLLASTTFYSSQNVKLLAPLIAGLLVSVVAMWRAGPFMLLIFLVSSAPFWLLILTRLSSWQRVALVTPVALTVSFNAFLSSNLYRTSDWQLSRKVWGKLVAIRDTYIAGSIEPIGLNQGWSGSDIALFLGYFWTPSESFSLDSLESFLTAANPQLVGMWAVSPPNFDSLTSALAATRAGWLVAILGALICLLTFWMSGKLVSFWTLYVVAGTALSIAIIIFLGLIRNNPAHVALSVGFINAISCVGTAALILRTNLGGVGKKSLGRGESTFSWSSLFLASIFCLISLVVITGSIGPAQAFRDLQGRKQTWNSYEQTYMELNDECPIIGVLLGLEVAPASSPTPAREFPLIQLGWMSLTPLTNLRLRYLGSSSWNDLFSASACTYFVGSDFFAGALSRQAHEQQWGIGEFIRVEVPVEGAPEVWQWQGN